MTTFLAYLLQIGYWRFCFMAGVSLVGFVVVVVFLCKEMNKLPIVQPVSGFLIAIEVVLSRN